MFKLYLKIALRYLLKNKLYSIINIVGLAIGVASFILIMIYVNNENSYDSFTNSENVYRVYMDYKEGDSYEPGDAQTYNLSGPIIKETFPEVSEYVRFYYFEKVTFNTDDQLLTQNSGALADHTYFDIFKYDLLKGDKKNVLTEPNTIVLNESLEKKLFGKNSGLGKTVSVYSSGEEIRLIVTGVMQDLPSSSHFNPTFLISFASQKTWEIFNEDDYRPNWNMNNFYTYISLDKNTNVSDLREKIFKLDIGDNEGEERHNIEAIESIHLESSKPYEIETNGSATRVKFLSAIAFIILILSWLNYVNLSSTKSLERAKEIGIRKVAGAQRQQIVIQSLLESLVLNFISLVLALAIALIFLPIYNGFTGSEITIGLSNLRDLTPILSIILAGMLVAGLYPAIVLSNYSPVKALKGKVKIHSGGLSIRKGLIITQFVATIVLLIGTIVVTKQMAFMNNQPVGADMNNIITLNGSLISEKPDSLLVQDYLVLQNELNNKSFIKNTSSAGTYPGDAFDNLSSSRGITMPNGEENESSIFYTFAADSNFFELTNIPFAAGENFRSSKLWSRNIVVNEMLLKELEIQSHEDILDKTLQFWGEEWTVTGIVENHYHFGVKKPALPMIYRQGFTSDNMLVKFDDQVTSHSDISSALADVEITWKRIFPQSTFSYSFLDEKFEAQYNDDKMFAKAFTIFTLLAIFIASLGLFGLTSYTCIQKRKEIGIRKVNGATVLNILKMLNKNFIAWIGIAFIIAAPLGLYVMGKWLENFPLKTEISWWIFLAAGTLVILISLITVSWQSINAALSNPINTLKDE